MSGEGERARCEMWEPVSDETGEIINYAHCIEPVVEIVEKDCGKLRLCREHATAFRARLAPRVAIV